MAPFFSQLFWTGHTMTYSAKSWFGECRSGFTTWFELATVAQGWRRDLHDLEGKRIARDQAAARQMQDAARAADWNGFSADAQSALRDYLSATAQIWQEAVRLASGNQGALASALERAVGNGFATWAEFWRGMPGIDATGQPAREWMSIFERMMNTAGMPAVPVTSSGAAPSRAGERRAAQGEQHVG
jgi:hypothetical protein